MLVQEGENCDLMENRDTSTDVFSTLNRPSIRLFFEEALSLQAKLRFVY